MLEPKSVIVDGSPIDNYFSVTCKPIFEWVEEARGKVETRSNIEYHSRLEIVESALSHYYHDSWGCEDGKEYRFCLASGLREQPHVVVSMTLDDSGEDSYTATVIFKQDNNGTIYAFTYTYVPV
jgi:hypothetical protein